MCLAIPGRIVRVTVGTDGARTAEVEYPGERRRASLLFLPEAAVGDHVLVQAGFAIRRLTSEQAAEVEASLARAAELVDAHDRTSPVGARPAVPDGVA